MDDTELDVLLRRIDPAGPTPQLTDLVERARNEAPARRASGRLRRGGIAVGVSIGIIGSAAAGVTYSDYLLSQPPYTTMEQPGDMRPTTGMEIVAQYGPDAGEVCLLFPEFRNITSEQLVAVQAHILSRPDWHDWSERTGAEARLRVANDDYTHNPDGVPLEDAWNEALRDALQAEMEKVIPDLQYMGAGPGQPFIPAWGYSCR